MKFKPLSLARAFDNKVLPVPERPYNKIPFTCCKLNFPNISEYFIGRVNMFKNSCLMLFSPPISFSVTSGISTKTSRTAEGSTSSKAFKKCFMLTSSFEIFSYGISCSWKFTNGRISRTHDIAASLARASRSAPTNPCDKSEIFLRSTSFARGIPRVCIFKISSLPFLSGIGIEISLSNLPGRLRAGSNEFGIFVAPITINCPRDLSPSIKANN